MSLPTLPQGRWHFPESTRIPHLDQQTLLQRLLLGITRRQAGADSNLNVFLILARLGRIFPRYLLFLSHMLMKGRIARIDKERIILRAAWRMGCVYEWGHHAHMARDLGVSESVIRSLAEEDCAGWDSRLRAFVRATDELIAGQRLSDETWASLKQQLSNDQCVEFCMLVGHYMMVAMTINAAGVRLEPGYLDGVQ